jgi:hypothetical protein
MQQNEEKVEKTWILSSLLSIFFIISALKGKCFWKYETIYMENTQHNAGNLLDSSGLLNKNPSKNYPGLIISPWKFI